jgi:hypothetical protein
MPAYMDTTVLRMYIGSEQGSVKLQWAMVRRYVYINSVAYLPHYQHVSVNILTDRLDPQLNLCFKKNPTFP